MLDRILSKKGRCNVWLSLALALRPPKKRNYIYDWGLSWIDFELPSFGPERLLTFCLQKIYWYPLFPGIIKEKKRNVKKWANYSIIVIWPHVFTNNTIQYIIQNYVLNSLPRTLDLSFKFNAHSCMITRHFCSPFSQMTKMARSTIWQTKSPYTQGGFLLFRP